VPLSVLDERLDSEDGRKFPEHLSNYQLSKKCSGPFRYFFNVCAVPMLLVICICTGKKKTAIMRNVLFSIIIIIIICFFLALDISAFPKELVS
jgi:hypothetical protein